MGLQGQGSALTIRPQFGRSSGEIEPLSGHPLPQEPIGYRQFGVLFVGLCEKRTFGARVFKRRGGGGDESAECCGGLNARRSRYLSIRYSRRY